MIGLNDFGTFQLSTLSPSDAIWRHQSRSILAQVMAWPHQTITWTNVFFVLRIHLRTISRRMASCPVYPKKYAHGFVVLCFVVVTQSFIMNSHEVCIHIHQGCFAATGAIVRLPQCQWSKPDGYGKISQCITTTKHSKAKTVCVFFGIYCKIAVVFPQAQWF